MSWADRQLSTLHRRRITPELLRGGDSLLRCLSLLGFCTPNYRLVKLRASVGLTINRRLVAKAQPQSCNGVSYGYECTYAKHVQAGDTSRLMGVVHASTKGLQVLGVETVPDYDVYSSVSSFPCPCAWVACHAPPINPFAPCKR